MVSAVSGDFDAVFAGPSSRDMCPASKIPRKARELQSTCTYTVVRGPLTTAPAVLWAAVCHSTGASRGRHVPRRELQYSWRRVCRNSAASDG